MKNKISLFNQSIIPVLLILASYLGVSVSFGKIYLIHFVLLIATPSFLFLVFKNNKVKEVVTNNWLFFVWIIYLAITLLWTEHLGNGIRYLAQVTLGCITAIYISFFLDNQKYRTTLKYLLFATLALSLLETFSDFRYPISKYSDLLYLFNKTSNMEDVNLDLPTAFFWTPNNLTYILLLFLPSVARVENTTKRVTLFALILFVMLRASSRGIFALSIFYLFYILIKKYSQGVNLNLRKLSLIAGISLGGLFFSPKLLTENNLKELKSLSWILTKHVSSTYEIIFENKDISTLTIRRLVMLASTVKSIKQAPILGNGSGYLLDKTGPFRDRALDVSTPHFYWLEVMAHGGALLLFIIFYWFFDKFRANSKDRAKREVILLFILGAPACSSLVYFFPAWLVLGLISSRFSMSNLFKMEA